MQGIRASLVFLIEECHKLGLNEVARHLSRALHNFPDHHTLNEGEDEANAEQKRDRYREAPDE